MSLRERTICFRCLIISAALSALVTVTWSIFCIQPNKTNVFTYTCTQNATTKIGAICYQRYGFKLHKSKISEEQRRACLLNNLKTVHEVFTFPSSSHELISQLQEAQMEVLGPLVKGYKYAMLFGLYTDENKGDPAIGLGEIMFLRRMNVELVFHCEQSKCKENLDTAILISKRYSRNDLVIFLQGGGDMAQWHNKDSARARVIKYFRKFKIILFPQSIYLRPAPESWFNLEFCKRAYSSHPRLTLLFRDTPSLYKARELFPNTRSLLVPDMAYQIGSVSRTMAPTHDIVWIRRKDHETPDILVPRVPDGIRMSVLDLVHWFTHTGDVMKNQFLMTHNGFTFLQRGRVVITDRLHGHIMCILLDIPHVIIDSKTKKISNHYITWAQNLDNVKIAKTGHEAVQMAIEMLQRLDKKLPKVVGYFNSTEQLMYTSSNRHILKQLSAGTK